MRHHHEGWVVVFGVAACGSGSPDDRIGHAIGGDAPTTDERGQGRITILEGRLGAFAFTYEQATFSTTLERVDGPCVIRTARASSPFTSAGDVTIAADDDVVTLQPSSYGALQQGLRYSAGTRLVIEASGATVPAFESKLRFPTSIAVTRPPPLTKSGYAVEWTGTGPARIMIGQTGTSIVCDYTTSPATIAPSTLRELAVGTGPDLMISIMVGGRTNTTIAAGDYDVDVEALSLGYDGATFLD